MKEIFDKKAWLRAHFEEGIQKCICCGFQISNSMYCDCCKERTLKFREAHKYMEEVDKKEGKLIK